ncbi:MAG: hypothetical protein OXE58_09515, partial [Acidobacteria bacterium]|nr:hypothetical protein [Acidobacteriota bacterium]
MTVVERFFRPPAGSFFLFGPRGVGKTTWFRANAPDALVLDLLVGSRYRELSSHPERLRDLVVASASRDIVIDEIQRVLAFRVPVFTKRAKRRLASHPKFFFFDCGLYRTL